MDESRLMEVGALQALPRLVEAFRTGEGIGIVAMAGFTRFRRAAETPFNLVFEARP
jgi:hypothetical protein